MLRFRTVFALAVIMLPGVSAKTETTTNLGVTAGYTDNLFADSSQINDSYTRAEGSLSIYPSMAAVLNISGSYTSFARTSDLNCYDLNAGSNYVWGQPTGATAVFFSAGGSLRHYGEYYREYSRYGIETGLGLRRQFGRSAQGRLGAGFNASFYPNADNDDSKRLAGVAGFNVTLPGSNSVDLEASVVHTWLADQTGNLASEMEVTAPAERLTADITSLHYRVRWSRPVGQRVGLSLNATGRAYLSQQPIVPGYSLDNLSPWSDFYEGYTAGIDVKTFFIPHTILGCGAAYRHADYADALESETAAEGSSYYLSERSDDRASVYLEFKRPVKLAGDGLFTPILEVGYLNNSSSLSRYDYSSVSVSLRLTVKP